MVPLCQRSPRPWVKNADTRLSHKRHALACARACESERDVRFLLETFDEDHQVIPLRIEILDGRLARIAHAKIELAGGFIMRGARCLCDQHASARLADG